ncbi:MAG: hypothetical protein KAG97_12065, partial [Victivallales bacterium]|nr:hypothetical protein [Victivallales bacterium]
MRLKIVVALSFFSLLAASIAAPSPIPSKADYPLIDSLNYKNEKALRESWKPMSDTTPVSMVIMKSGKALEMSCDYEKRKCDRSSWDLSVDLDLTVCNGIQFKIFCDDPTPISGFTFYMRNGRGWYSREFSVNRVGKWNTVIIEKSKTGVEGT